MLSSKGEQISTSAFAVLLVIAVLISLISNALYFRGDRNAARPEWIPQWWSLNTVTRPLWESPSMMLYWLFGRPALALVIAIMYLARGHQDVGLTFLIIALPNATEVGLYAPAAFKASRLERRRR